MNRPSMLIIVLVLAALVFGASTFTVHEREKAIKLALGEIVRADYEPGLHFKIPFYNNVFKFESRILTLDARPERVLTSEKKNVVVDAFVKWRIADVERFYRSTSGDERNALTRLSQFTRKGVLDAVGKRTVQEVISGERVALMSEIQTQMAEPAQELGIVIVDVRLKKVELPPDVSDAVYSRMEKERATVAKAFRSRGEEQAKGIRADAERQREEVLAEAYSESEQIRGEGDAAAAQIYAKAYGRDREFYNFYRSLNAYREAFSSQGDILVLQPDSEFFRYFNQSGGSQ